MKIALPLRRAIAAVFVVFLHYLPQITLYLDDGERYYARWGLGNIVRIGAGVFCLSATAWAIDSALRRWATRGVDQIYEHLFLVALLSGSLAAFPVFTADHPIATNCIWWSGLAVICVSLFWKRSRLVHYGAVMCLIFSPLVPIMFVEMLLWPRWDERPDPLPIAATEQEPAHPVFIFVFDEWSWPRSNREDQFTEALPHLRALSREATIYRHAFSPYWETSQSLPRIIFQTDAEFAVHDGATFLEKDGNSMSSRDSRSLLQAAHEAGYRTYLLGFLHAYRHMLGNQVDVCLAYFSGDEASTAEQLADEFLENSRNWPDPLSRSLGPALCDRLDVKNWRAMAHRYRADMFRVLAECPRRSLVVFHVPAPHAPFVFNADGSDRPASTMQDTGDLDGYRQQLGYVDRLVGEVVDTLRRSGKYDDSLLILTSDHSWRRDPDPAMRQTVDSPPSVPLVIKRPGQTAAEVIDEPFCTNRLMPLVESVLKPKPTNPTLTEAKP